MYHKNIWIKIQEHDSRTRKPWKKLPILEKPGPCASNHCYGGAFGVLRPASLCKFEKKILSLSK